MTDRLSLAQALETASIKRDAAERIATEIYDAITANVATKPDLAQLGGEMKADLARFDAALPLLATKAELQTGLAQLELRLILWVVGTGISGVVILASLILKFWR